MEAMNDELLIAKFSGYECDIRNYLQLIHLFKDDNGKSRRKIVADIEAASEKAISSLKCLQSELIDDTIYLFNQQLKDYELYEDELNERFSEVRENVKKAYGMSQEAKNAAAIKLNKAIYALEPPKEKVVSFLDLHTNLAKSSIGVVISDTAHTLKSIPFDRKPLKKKLEKHADVRLPSASSLQVGQPSASSNTEIETNSKPTLSSALPRQPAQQFNKMNLSDPMMTSIPDVSASSSSKAMSKGAISDHTDQDLLSSAAQAWAYLQSQTGATPTKCIESQMLDPPTVRICFSNFANDSQLAVADPRHRSLSLAGVKNPDTPLSKFINAPSNAGVLNASLNTLLGAPSLKLYFPIGVCPYDDGLVVCNSGDNTVLFIRHSSEGQVFNVLQLNSDFTRPSAVITDEKTGQLFVKDDRVIRCFGPDMELISSFPPFTQQLYGLVMTSDNHLLTMTRCGNGKALQMNPSLLKYTFRGHLVAVIPLQLPLLIKSKLRFMALSGNSLYISDLGASYVYWVDATTGKLVDVIAGPGEKPGCFTEPSGIACDSNGNILIGDSRSNRIQIFDGESREYKGVLECSQKTIVRPSAICLQGDDKLIAVNYISHSVSFYSIIVETSHLSK